MAKWSENRRPWIILLAIIAIFTVFGLSRVFGAPWSSNPTPFPTDYPGPKQTIVVAEAQTREAAYLTPLPTGGLKLTGPQPTPMPEQIYGPSGTPMGTGILTEFGSPRAFYMDQFRGHGHAWFQRVGHLEIAVYAGYDTEDPDQGVVIVSRFGPNGLIDESWNDTPTKSGSVWIVDAVGERLILSSEGGETFYFDVPGDQFTDSLDEIVPTITPAPIPPTSTPIPEIMSDDAPDVPSLVFEESPLNTDLLYYINPSGDEDWFLFHTDTIGNIKVSLTNLPASYGFSVLRVSDQQWVGTVDENGTGDKTLELADAPAGDYLVRVFGIGGAWNAELPYTLRFGPVLSGFVVLGEEGVYLKQNAVIESGDVGANTASDGPYLAGNEEVTIGIGATLNDPNSRLMGDSIKVKQNAQVYGVYYNELSGTGVVLGEHFTPIELPLTTSFPQVPSFTPGTENFDIPQGESFFLHGGSYGVLKARQGATVTLAGGIYNFEEWDIGLNVDLLIKAPTTIRISEKLYLDQGSYLGPSPELIDLNASDVIFYITGINGTNGNLGATPKAAEIGINSTVIANVFAPYGTLWLRQNSHSTGSFIGKWVVVDIGAQVNFEGGWR